MYYVDKMGAQNQNKCSIRNFDVKSSVARHLNSNKHSLSELHYMDIGTVRML